MRRRPGWVLAVALIAVPIAFFVGRSTADEPATDPGTTFPSSPSAVVRPTTVTRPPAVTRPPTASRPETTTSIVGAVTSVVDGDTIRAAGERIRVIGIDTPERGDCGFSESSARMRELVDGRTVAIVGSPGQTRDRYRRLLGYVEIDGVDVGRVLIEEGFARARYDSQDGYPAHPREDDYRALDAATPDLCG